MKTLPYKHQVKERSRWVDPARALLWQMRTGKSKTIIDNACWLAGAEEIRGVLVIAPNGVHTNWIVNEIPKHHWNMQHEEHGWRFSDPKNAGKFDFFMRCIIERPHALAWLAVNLEVIARDDVKKIIKQFARACGDRIMIVFDESHHLARPGAKRTRAARGIARLGVYRRILTGTAVENSPLQAYSQYELLERSALGHDAYRDFAEAYSVEGERRNKRGQRYRVIEKYVNTDDLRRRMSRYSSVVLRSDCQDLPPVQVDKRMIELTSKQVKMWRAMKETIIEELEMIGFTRPIEGGAKLVKLQQIEGGFLKTESGEILRLNLDNENPKMLVLVDEIEQYSGQVITWFQFIHEIQAAASFLKLRGIRCSEFHGRINITDRDQSLADFKKGKTTVMLGQPMAGGEGRDMSVAGKILRYSQTPDATVRNQSNERATAMGGRSVQIVDILAHGGTDDYFLKLTQKKTTLADEIARSGMRAVLNSLEI